MIYKKIVTLSLLFFTLLLTACASNTTAQQNFLLGQQYYRAQNYGDAFDAISKAAKQGNVDAQYALGYMYFNGTGTDVDQNTGTFWMKQAAAKGQPQAIKALSLLNKS